jgi:phytoene synthase
MMPASLEQAYRACAAVTRERAGNFKHAFVFLDRPRRRAIEAVYAFSRRADDIADDPAPLESRRQRLGRLREALHRPPADDAVLTALADTIARYRIPLEPFDDLLDGVVQDLDVRRYETFEELSAYCARVASTIGLICLEIFGYEGGDVARGHAHDLGVAMQLTNILRDVREDAERGRVYLPRDELRRFGLSDTSLTDGADVEPFLRFQITRARDFFSRGLQLLPHVTRRARPCPAALAAIYGRLLDRMDADPGRVLRERISLPSLEKKLVAFGAMVRSLF